MEQELKKRIEELEKWKLQQTRQQITYPLDEQSIKILKNNFVSIVDEYVYYGGANLNPFLVFVGEQGNRQINLSDALVQYEANSTLDTLTIVRQTAYTRFPTNEQVVLYTTDTMPTGLNGGGMTTYHVVSASSDGYSFKLAATSGGVAINFTSNGVGKLLITKV